MNLTNEDTSSETTVASNAELIDLLTRLVQSQGVNVRATTAT